MQVAAEVAPFVDCRFLVGSAGCHSLVRFCYHPVGNFGLLLERDPGKFSFVIVNWFLPKSNCKSVCPVLL